MKQTKLISWAIIGFLAFFILISLSFSGSSPFQTLAQQERGVLFRRFGGGLDKEHIYRPGFHFIAPWNTLYRYKIRNLTIEEAMTVLSSNGLNIDMDVTIRVRPIVSKIGDLHENFGQKYVEILVSPEVRSSVRKIIGQFTPEELYSTRRDEVQKLIQTDLEANLKKNFVELTATLIRDIELPEKVRNAIEEKIEAEQKAEKYVYLLDQERKEAERKIIEAEGKAEANRIISASLTDKILRDKGIEATVKLSNSSNAKTVIVGAGDSGLPLILGGQ